MSHAVDKPVCENDPLVHLETIENFCHKILIRYKHISAYGSSPVKSEEATDGSLGAKSL